MVAFLKTHVLHRGFEVRYPSNSGVAGKPGHSGSARCWCWQPPPVTLKSEEHMQPSHPPARATAQRSTSRSGHQTKAGCRWSINFSRHADGIYTLTGLVHRLLSRSVTWACSMGLSVGAHMRASSSQGWTMPASRFEMTAVV